jgi:steroid delta-isomerase-like uncharacterized protein
MSNTNVPDIVNLSQIVEEQNTRVVRRFFEAAATGDTSKAYEFIGPDWFNPDSQANSRLAKLRGPEGFIEAIKVLHNAFADLHYEEEQIVVSKDKVVAVMSVRGRHIGENAGIPATGRSFSTSAVEIFKIANGKIIEHRAFRDRLRFLIQVGVLGPSSPEYELVFQTLKDSASK